jgi:hypothetical protein
VLKTVVTRGFDRHGIDYGARSLADDRQSVRVETLAANVPTELLGLHQVLEAAVCLQENIYKESLSELKSKN